MIVISAVSTIIGGGGLYFQWSEYNKTENSTVKVETAQIVQKEGQVTEKRMGVEKTINIESDSKFEKEHTNLASVSLKEDMPALTQPIEATKKESKPTKNLVDDLELPSAKGFDDFDKDGF